MSASAALTRHRETPASSIVCRQATALHGFRYTVRDAVTDHDLGEIVWPTIAQAKNARLRLNDDPRKGEVTIWHGKKRFGVSYEFLDRGWVNDVRFTLLDGETQLAVAELRTQRRIFARAKVQLLQPEVATFVRTSRFPKMAFELQAENASSIGTICDRAVFMTVREMVANLPDSWPVPTKMFALFLSLHLVQTQA